MITESILDPSVAIDAVRMPACGATSTFLGTTRDHNAGRAVVFLEYEAYRPMADEMLARISEELKQRWDLGNVAILHRIGRVDVGEISLVVAVSSAHRGDAFAACEHAIVRIKQVVPIWKKEHFEGGQVWIGTQDGREFDPLRSNWTAPS